MPLDYELMLPQEELMQDEGQSALETEGIPATYLLKQKPVFEITVHWG